MQEGRQKTSGAALKEKTTAVLIANPTSGSYTQQARQIAETVTYLCQHGWQADLQLTQSAGDARRIASAAVAQKVNVVIAVGGDGTINEIIQELAGSETALGVLPSGTVNVWAREIGIPLDNVKAREILLNGQVRRIDLGQMDERYFLLMVGIGVDGEIAHAVEKKPIKRLGVIGYLLMTAWKGLGYQDFRVFLELGERVIRINALQVVIGNTQLYAGAMKYTWQAKCDDGLLDICVVRKQSMFRRVIVLTDFLLRRKERKQWVRYETGSTLKIHTNQRVAIQLDGEAAGHTAKGSPPTIFTVAHHALKVIIPRETVADIFSNAAVD